MTTRPAEFYVKHLDEDVQQFIEDYQLDTPENIQSLSLAEQRVYYEKHCQRFRQPRPAGITSQDNTVTVNQGAYPVPIRTYQPANLSEKAHLLYYHGGGFVVGNLQTHDDLCAELSAQTGCPLTAVNYRLAPENPYPAAFDDACAVFQHFAQHQDAPLILIGDSAGANLAAAVSHTNRAHAEKIAGQILIYPVLGIDLHTPSYHEHAEAPLLSRADMHSYFIQYGVNPTNQPQDIAYAPLNDPDFSNLPTTFISTADCDPLRDDGRLYYEKMQAAGGQVNWVDEVGLVHGHLRARHRSKKAQASFACIVQAIREMAQ